MKCLVSITDSKDMNLSKLQETVKGREVLQSMGWQRVRHYLTTEQQQQQRPMSLVRWRMATSGSAQDSCSTALLSHQQSDESLHTVEDKTLIPSPKQFSV